MTNHPDRQVDRLRVITFKSTDSESSPTSRQTPTFSHYRANLVLAVTAAVRTIPSTGSLKINISLLTWPKICSNTINFLEHFQLRVNLTYSLRGDLLIDLRSPQGTVSNLAQNRLADLYSGQNNLTGWTFITLHNWGEKAQGTWELALRNHDPVNRPNNTGALYSWTLILYGTETNPLKENPHVYPTTVPPRKPSPSTPSPTYRTTVKSSTKLGSGAVAGIVIAVVLAFVIVGVLISYLMKRKPENAHAPVPTRDKQVDVQERNQESPSVHV